MQSFRRHAGQYLAMLCNVLPLASVSPSALLHQGHSPVRMDEIATFSRWKSGFGFFLTFKKTTPCGLSVLRKREKIILENIRIKEEAICEPS